LLHQASEPRLTVSDVIPVLSDPSHAPEDLRIEFGQLRLDFGDLRTELSELRTKLSELLMPVRELLMLVRELLMLVRELLRIVGELLPIGSELLPNVSQLLNLVSELRPDFGEAFIATAICAHDWQHAAHKSELEIVAARETAARLFVS
jgi:hypothetical protein